MAKQQSEVGSTGLSPLTLAKHDFNPSLGMRQNEYCALDPLITMPNTIITTIITFFLLYASITTNIMIHSFLHCDESGSIRLVI